MASITNLGELIVEVNKMGAALIDGSLNPQDTVAIISKDSGLVSTIHGVKVEEHREGENDEYLIGRTIWLEIEEV